MRKIALCLAVLLSAVTVSTASWANGDGFPRRPSSPPYAAPPPYIESAPPCSGSTCEHVVTGRRVVGYREQFVPEHVARVPVYRRYKKVVHDDCCAPPPAQATVTPPPPKHITVEQQVFVRVVPRITYVPAEVRVAPPVCCPPGQVIPGVRPCPPAGATGYYGGGSYATAALSVNPIGVPTGRKCDPSDPRPYPCASGMCVCKP